MFICHITSVHPRYDIRIFVKECKTLIQEHKVSLIVADNKGNEVKDGIDIYDVGRVKGRINRILFTPRLILKKILELKPDIVHFHDPELIGIGQKLAKLGYKIIYDVHEDVPNQILAKHWIPKWLRPILSKLIAKKEAKLSQNLAGIISATEIIAARFKKYNPNTIALYNYPILAEFAENITPWHERNDNLCYIGSISESRGVIQLIDSLALSKCQLDLAGPFSYREIAEKIKTSPGYKYVNYHGVLNRKQISTLLAKVKIGAAVLSATPAYKEALPTKLFEFMLAGIPVIAPDFPILKPIVENNQCGLLVTPDDAQSIAAATKWLIENPLEAEKMGKRGRAAALKYYNWEAEQSKLLEFYKNLLHSD